MRFPIIIFKLHGDEKYLSIPDLNFEIQVVGDYEDTKNKAIGILRDYELSALTLPRPSKLVDSVEQYDANQMSSFIATTVTYQPKTWWNKVVRNVVSWKNACLLLAAIVVAYVGQWLVAVFLNYIGQSSANFWFYVGDDSSSHFQWVGISVLLAVLGIFYNQYWDRKKIVADIRSKSRIDWMKTVRDSLVEYEKYSLNWIQLSQQLLNTYVPLLNSAMSQLSPGEIEKLRLKYDDKVVEESINSMKARDKIQLYVSKSADNRLLLNGLNVVEQAGYKFQRQNEAVMAMVQNALVSIDVNERKNAIEAIRYMNDNGQRGLEAAWTELNERGSIYFKNEWDRAKSGR